MRKPTVARISISTKANTNGNGSGGISVIDFDPEEYAQEHIYDQFNFTAFDDTPYDTENGILSTGSMQYGDTVFIERLNIHKFPLYYDGIVMANVDRASFIVDLTENKDFFGMFLAFNHDEEIIPFDLHSYMKNNFYTHNNNFADAMFGISSWVDFDYPNENPKVLRTIGIDSNNFNTIESDVLYIDILSEFDLYLKQSGMTSEEIIEFFKNNSPNWQEIINDAKTSILLVVTNGNYQDDNSILFRVNIQDRNYDIYFTLSPRLKEREINAQANIDSKLKLTAQIEKKIYSLPEDKDGTYLKLSSNAVYGNINVKKDQFIQPYENGKKFIIH